VVSRVLSAPMALVIAALGGSTALLAARLPLLLTRRFDTDEFEHAHVAWCIVHGHIPYRDFFEHHTPLFHYLLAGVLWIFGVDASAEAGMRALFAARFLTWTLSVAIVVLTVFLARRLFDTRTAWVAMAIVATSFIVALRALEIRPDGLSTVLWLAALMAGYRAMTSGEPGAAATRRMFALSGLALGCAVLASQKLLVAGPSVALLLAWYCASARFGGTRRQRATAGAWQIAGVAAPWILAIAFFAAQGAAADFIDGVLFENLTWKREVSAGNTLGFITHYNPWFLALAAGGAVALAVGTRRQDSQWVPAVFLLVHAAVPFAGLFVTPVPYPQYCLIFIPLFAILGGRFLVALVEGQAPAASVIAATVLAAIGLVQAAPMVVHPIVYPVLVVAAVIALGTSRMHRRPAVALGVFLIMLYAQPAQWTRWLLSQDDAGQFGELRFVLNTPRDAVVMDGWSGYGVFRRHAWYYWMLHPGVRAMLPEGAAVDLAASLTSGRTRPDVVVFDSQLRQISPGVTSFIEQHYAPSGVGDIYVPRQR
jgi:4-amino-4-deoxy-L-arabinose transferase-like glycosyltransferase